MSSLPKPLNLERVGVGTKQTGFRPLGTPAVWTASSTALAAAGAYAHQRTVPTHDPTTGLYVVTGLPCANMLSLCFAGARDGGDPDNQDATGRLWLLGPAQNNPTQEEVLGEFQFDLALTCGSKALATSSVLLHPTSGWQSKWIDTITVTNDRSLYPGARVTGSNADNARAVVNLDFSGHNGFAIQLLKGTIGALLPLYRTF